jgi:hypothetical protein
MPTARAGGAACDEAIMVGDGGLIGRARISDAFECDTRITSR